MTDEDMKQYLPLWREAEAKALDACGYEITATKHREGALDDYFKPSSPAYQAIKLMVEGWKPETKEDVAREMLARAYPLSAGLIRGGGNGEAVAYLARCLPDGIKIADLPGVSAPDQGECCSEDGCHRRGENGKSADCGQGCRNQY